MKNKKTINILLAEDDLANQELIKAFIEDYEWIMDIANTGNEALSYARENSYNIILMDIQMPELNGFDVTKKIREEEQLTKTHTPIIALTAYAMKNDREKCLNAGMDDYLSKPIDYDDFFEKLKKYTNVIL